jgi:hypothetical protein
VASHIGFQEIEFLSFQESRRPELVPMEPGATRPTSTPSPSSPSDVRLVRCVMNLIQRQARRAKRRPWPMRAGSQGRDPKSPTLTTLTLLGRCSPVMDDMRREAPEDGVVWHAQPRAAERNSVPALIMFQACSHGAVVPRTVSTSQMDELS